MNISKLVGELTKAIEQQSDAAWEIFLRQHGNEIEVAIKRLAEIEPTFELEVRRR